MIRLNRDESEPMKKAHALTLPPRPRPRPESARRRPTRSFAPESLGLESRTVLSSATVTASVASIVFLPPPLPNNPSGPNGDNSPSPNPRGWHDSDGQTPGGPSNPGRPRNHVGMTEADIRIEGKLTPEFAFADPTRNMVAVKVGFGGPPTILSAAQGIDNPQAVVLADVNGDGVPDLLVANSAGGNVEIFPGLPGGGLGPAINGPGGFAVGNFPTGITVGDLNGDGITDLVVANRDSNTVDILSGQGGGASWTLVKTATLPAGDAPVKTVLKDTNADGNLDLYICNSGSNNVTIYRGTGDGEFDTANPTSINVGIEPTEMFIGRFDHRTDLDLITVNSGSNNLTFLAGINSNNPTTMTFTSGGSQPDAAFAVDLNHDGVLDLVVANSGDGRVALLQGGNVGFQLAGVISRADLPSPTAIAPALVTETGLDFFAASAGQDAAQLLHFDLGSASAFLSVPLDTSTGGLSGPEADLISQLLPFEGSDLEMIAVLWDGGPTTHSTSLNFEERGQSLSTIPDAELETGLEEFEQERTVTSPDPSPLPGPPTLATADIGSWTRYVLGLDLALGDSSEPIEAVADRDRSGAIDDRTPEELVRRSERSSVDPDQESTARTLDEALQSLRSEAPTEARASETPAHPETRPGEIPSETQPTDTVSQEPGFKARVIPILISAITLATSMILQATTSPRFTIRGKARRRPVASATDPDRRRERRSRL